MNYYKAREKMDENGQGTGLWHYTCANDGYIYPVGYCSPLVDCPECKKNNLLSIPKGFGGPDCVICEGKRYIRSENACPGHATPDEACDHYKQYLVDHTRISEPKSVEWPKYKCSVKDCNEEGNRMANVQGSMYFELCEKHANKDVLNELVSVGECWSS